MANEVTVNLTLAYDDGTTTVSSSLVDLQVSPTTLKVVKLIQAIGTTEEALQLGEVTSLGLALIKNLDSTNFVELRTGTGATKFVKLLAGEACLFRFGSGVTAPYAIADTASVNVEILIIST